MAKVNAE